MPFLDLNVRCASSAYEAFPGPALTRPTRPYPALTRHLPDLPGLTRHLPGTHPTNSAVTGTYLSLTCPIRRYREKHSLFLPASTRHSSLIFFPISYSTTTLQSPYPVLYFIITPLL